MNGEPFGAHMDPLPVIYEPDNYLWPWSWEAVFGNTRPVHVDLGCGDGGFLCQAAAARRETNFLGVERLLGRVRKIERRSRREGLSNVRVLRLETLYTVSYLMPTTSVEGVHLYHPDPFPKKKQHKRRLVQAPFAEAVRRVLRPGGTLFLRTDHEEYFQVMLEVFGACPGLVRLDGPDPFEALQTDFEKEYRAKGQPIFKAMYRGA